VLDRPSVDGQRIRPRCVQEHVELAKEAAPASASLRGFDLNRACLDWINSDHLPNGLSARRANGLEMSRPASQKGLSRVDLDTALAR